MTVKFCNRLAFGAYRFGYMKIIEVFSFILTRIMLGLLSPGSAEADVGVMGT